MEQVLIYQSFTKNYLPLWPIHNSWQKIAQIWDLQFKIQGFEIFELASPKASNPWISEESSCKNLFSFPKSFFTKWPLTSIMYLAWPNRFFEKKNLGYYVCHVDDKNFFHLLFTELFGICRYECKIQLDLTLWSTFEGRL